MISLCSAETCGGGDNVDPSLGRRGDAMERQKRWQERWANKWQTEEEEDVNAEEVEVCERTEQGGHCLRERVVGWKRPRLNREYSSTIICRFADEQSSAACSPSRHTENGAWWERRACVWMRKAFGERQLFCSCFLCRFTNWLVQMQIRGRYRTAPSSFPTWRWLLERTSPRNNPLIISLFNTEEKLSDLANPTDPASCLLPLLPSHFYQFKTNVATTTISTN